MTVVDPAVMAPTLRAVPGTLHGAGRMVERSILVYRRTWLIIVSGFFEPLFYLLSIRIGFGALVGDIETAAGPVDYAVFVAPALMASSAMNGAVYDSTMNIFFKLKHARLYETVLATPLGPSAVAVGEISRAHQVTTMPSAVMHTRNATEYSTPRIRAQLISPTATALGPSGVASTVS